MGAQEKIGLIGVCGESSSSPTGKVKLFCSHGGKILPRPSDGTLKYVGGETRVVVVHRYVTFSELMRKIKELFDGEYVLKYQIASVDLDSLVSVKSDEDIHHMLDEYDRLEKEGTSKLRIFLFPVKPALESHTTFSGLGPHAIDQRFMDTLNAIARPINFGPKLHLNTTRLKSYSPSPSEVSPQSLSPRSTAAHNSYLPQENGMISSLQSRLARVQKVQSSPNLCNLVNHQNSGTLLSNNYCNQQSYNQYCAAQQQQHYHNGCQPSGMPQDHHYTQHGYQSPTLQQDLQCPSHHGYQSPSDVQDHYSHPSQHLMARTDIGKGPFVQGPAGHHNATYYYQLSRGYPGSGGHSRWSHLEQYAVSPYGNHHLTRADSLPRSPDDPWD